ncbi:AmmeMemoRadiSam system protein B [Mesoterricola silvestris]|uniref:MEMO1 family protein METEAL_11090 n=1 Tax=Mesoterricola silvestris TaxID=2927979 RepID=A0AA48GM00_9BACT|nr:AmmeMemoRadiSam system protein B [Mesoterricola silvestris]BDU71935.1 MEMO1 family protein [Mesoterricola silvestris]
MGPIRQPAFAGSFYPADPRRLRDLVQGLLAQAPPGGPAPRAVIAPHAGYPYSGPVAAQAFARLGVGREGITRVAVLGPSHQVAFRGMAVSGAAGFATPLGTVPVDVETCEALQGLVAVRPLEDAHAREHSLEVQLPFLQVALGAFTLVPLVVGRAGPGEVAAVVERLWDLAGTVVVVSSDLSHYLGAAEARRVDLATAEAIRSLDAAALDEGAACGCAPVRGLLVAAARRGLRGEVLDLRNSGDTAGGRDRVVGYGAFAFA